MERRFFDLKVDVDVPGRWYLAEPTRLTGEEIDDIWQFTDGRPVDVHERMRIPVYRLGKPTDIEFAGAGQTPVVSARIATVLQTMAPDDIQLFPVEVEGAAASYSILNVVRTIRCIDDAACEEARLWTPEDGRPERVGEYHVVSGLRIDKSKVGTVRVFRLWGWHPPIIVDEGIKEALERAGLVGGRFDEV